MFRFHSLSELWREEGQSLGLEGTLSRGSDWRGLLSCIHSGPHLVPPKGTVLWSSLESIWGWSLKGTPVGGPHYHHNG